jgi:hypothetical protein
VCPKTAKTSLIDVSLACSTGKSYGFGAFRSAAEVFQAKMVHPANKYLQDEKGQYLSAVNSPCGAF